LERGFSSDDYFVWQQLSFLTILGLLGPLHYYTRHFGQFTEEPGRRGLLTGEGILEAAKGEIARGAIETPPDGKIDPSPIPICYIPWIVRPKKWFSLDCLRDSLLHRGRPVLAAEFDEPERRGR
jgi:hypothetical protein